MNSELSPRDSLLQRFRRVREASVAMCAPIAAEAYRIQPVAEVSPPWWNLGHTSWFFARNVLGGCGGEYLPEDELLDKVLNSYYVALGDRWERNRRGLLTRPTTEEVYRYRASVDRRIERFLADTNDARLAEAAWVVEVGIQHEQQHQELFYTEIKSILAQNPLPLRVAYRAAVVKPVPSADPDDAGADEWVGFAGGLYEFGNAGHGFAWDNERPVHRAWLDDFALQRRLVTCGEFAEFMDDGGYESPLLWLDNGWRRSQEEGWIAPLYWERSAAGWQVWTLTGIRPLDPREPVCHVSFYEADAFARWKSANFAAWRGARLPSEREWEHAARQLDANAALGHFLDSGRLHPAPAAGIEPIEQMLGDVWEWTASYYESYPGYVPFEGALAEYNGKFMDNQRVLRGGSCVSERDHIRPTYRNFWPAETRFQFTGFRLAR